MPTVCRRSPVTSPRSALVATLGCGQNPVFPPDRVDPSPSVSFFRERILTVRHRKVVWSAQGEPPIDRLLPRIRPLAGLVCCPCGSRDLGRMLADEFNWQVPARRARNPHPHQLVRRCRQSGWNGRAAPAPPLPWTSIAGTPMASSRPMVAARHCETVADLGATTRCRGRPAVRARATGRGRDRRCGRSGRVRRS